MKVSLSPNNLVVVPGETHETQPVAVPSRDALLQICRFLNILRKPHELPLVADGVNMEMQTLTAAIEQLKIENPESMHGTMILEPTVAAIYGGLDDPRDSANTGHEGLWERVLGSTRLLIPVWSPQPAHYTFLEARRDSLQADWQTVHYDSLPAAAKTGRIAAMRIADRLKLGQLPDTIAQGNQKDGCSCGLWVLRKMQGSLRRSGRPMLRNLQQQMRHINKFIVELRELANGRFRYSSKSKAGRCFLVSKVERESARGEGGSEGATREYGKVDRRCRGKADDAEAWAGQE